MTADDDFGMLELDDTCTEAGLRLRCEPLPTGEGDPWTGKQALCKWDPWGGVAVCAEDGALLLMQVVQSGDGKPSLSAMAAYGVCFGMLAYPSAELVARGTPSLQHRISHPITALDFLGSNGSMVFVQGRSNRLLLATLPELPLYARAGALVGAAQQSSSSTQDNSPWSEAATFKLRLVEQSSVVPLLGHDAQVSCIASNAPGYLLVSGDEAGVLCVRWIVLSATAAGDNTYRSEDLEMRRCSLQAHEGPIFTACHLPGSGSRGSQFATGGVGGWVKVWEALPSPADMAAGHGVQCLMKLSVGGCQVTCLSPSSSPESLLVGTLEGDILTYNISAVNDGQHEVSAVPNPRFAPIVCKVQHTSAAVVAVAVCRSGAMVAADSTGTMRIYDPDASALGGRAGNGWNLVAECQLGAPPSGLSFSESSVRGEGVWLLAGSLQGFLKIWRESALPCTESAQRASRWLQSPVPLVGDAFGSSVNPGENQEVEIEPDPQPEVVPQPHPHPHPHIQLPPKSSVGATAASAAAGPATATVEQPPHPSATRKKLRQRWDKKTQSIATPADTVGEAAKGPACHFREPTINSTQILLEELKLASTPLVINADAGGSSPQVSPRALRAAAGVVNIPANQKLYSNLTPLTVPENPSRAARSKSARILTSSRRPSIVGISDAIRPAEEPSYPFNIRTCISSAVAAAEGGTDINRDVDKLEEARGRRAAEADWEGAAAAASVLYL
jgi:hypothetical protein